MAVVTSCDICGDLRGKAGTYEGDQWGRILVTQPDWVDEQTTHDVCPICLVALNEAWPEKPTAPPPGRGSK